MDPERWRLINEVLADVLDVPEQERDRRLETLCAGHPGLRTDVDALLRADGRADPAFAASVLPPGPDAPALDSRIGPYRLIREIGRGGMGVVYLAEREDEYQKRVAIKIVRAGFGDSLLRRFQHERQILANLDHPNIAKLLDGGTTSQGFPYLVMEYIDGEPVTAYCDRHRLPLAARLRLYQSVCAAVHYAHQNLIVHRDLKPANILVMSDGTPKLLDFGIAKLLDDTDPRGGLTQTGLHPMTPDYASPEQARGAAVTTATDVYSLGVILYELVCGTRPYSVASGSPADIERALTESTPPRPSTHLPGLPGDIDNIVLMAMRKEPERRYVSAAALADDLQRHLDDFPVMARQDTFAYRASRFVRRNRAGIAASAIVAVVLITGAVVATWQAQRARREQALAEKRFADARTFAVSLIKDLASRQSESATALRAAFANRAVEYLGQLAAEARDDATLQLELAGALTDLGGFQSNPVSSSSGDSGAALLSYRKSIELLEPLHRAHPADRTINAKLATVHTMSGLLIGARDVTSALASYRRSEDFMAQAVAGASPQELWAPFSLSSVSDLTGECLGHPYYPNVGNTAEGTRLVKQALDMREAVMPRVPVNDVRTRLQLPDIYAVYAGMLWANGRIDEAVQLHQKSLHEYGRLLAIQPTGLAYAHAEYGLLHTRLANLLEEQSAYAEALDAARRGIAILEPLLAGDSSNHTYRRNLTRGYTQLGFVLLANEPAAAGEQFQKSKALIEQFLKQFPNEPEVRERLAENERGIGLAAAARGDRHGAEVSTRDALAHIEVVYQIDPRNAHYGFSLAQAYEARGDVLRAAGDRAAAAEAYARGIAVIAPMAAADAASWLKRRLAGDLEARRSGLALQASSRQRPPSARR